jgi:RNA polymerase sigma-70 factor (ECF subfamily)
MRADFRSFYDAHVRFVWRSLLRIGVPESDVADAAQDVFVVVHQKLAEFEGRSKATTWLFAICLRVASDRRRRALSRRECASMDPAHDQGCPEEIAPFDRQVARRWLQAILDRLPDEQRLVFCLFELEEMSGDEIAELLGVPVGTVRSRLRLAREAFREGVARLQAAERVRGVAGLKRIEAH